MTNTIKTYKLVTGEEIIAEFVEDLESTESFYVKNAFAVMMTQEGVGLVNWPMLVEDNSVILLNSNNIVATGTPKKEVINVYTEKTTGLSIVDNSSNIILTK